MPKHGKTPSTDTVRASGFDVTMGCGTQAALNKSGYTKEDVHFFARQLRIPKGNKNLDCLCEEIRALTLKKDPNNKAVAKNTERNLRPHSPTPAQQHRAYHVPINQLSPACTPIPLGDMVRMP